MNIFSKILTHGSFATQVMFKSKHKLDLGIVSFDQRGKEVLGFSETEFAAIGIYDIVHPEDLAYVASAHQECKSLSLSSLKPLFTTANVEYHCESSFSK